MTKTDEIRVWRCRRCGWDSPTAVTRCQICGCGIGDQRTRTYRPGDNSADIRTSPPGAPEPISDRTEQRRQAQRRRLIRPVDKRVDGERFVASPAVIARADATYDAATGQWRGVCAAPKALFPNQICGKEFWGPKRQKYCSPACQKRARRHDHALLDGPECPPVPLATGAYGPGDNRTDIRSDLPGAHEAVFDVTAPISDLPAVSAPPDPFNALGIAHSDRFRRVSTRYPHQVALAYDLDIARAARDSDEVVATTVAGWEAANGLEVRDWPAIGRSERGEEAHR